MSRRLRTGFGPLIVAAGTVAAFFSLAASAAGMRPATAQEVEMMRSLAPSVYADTGIEVSEFGNARIGTTDFQFAAADMAFVRDGKEYDRGVALFFIAVGGEPVDTVEVFNYPVTCGDTREADIDDVVADDLQLVSGRSCSKGRPRYSTSGRVKALGRRRATVNRAIDRTTVATRTCDRRWTFAIDLEKCIEAAMYRHYWRPVGRLLRAVRAMRASVSFGSCSKALDAWEVAVSDHRSDLNGWIISIGDGAAAMRVFARQLKDAARRSRAAWRDVSGYCALPEINAP